MIPVFIIQWIVGRSGGRLAARGAKILVYAALAVAVVGIALLAIAKRDKRVIDTHDARQDAAVLQSARDADVAADTAAAPREAQHASEAAQTQGVIRDATQARPADAARPSGPAVAAVTDELRRRRQTSNR